MERNLGDMEEGKEGKSEDKRRLRVRAVILPLCSLGLPFFNDFI